MSICTLSDAYIEINKKIHHNFKNLSNFFANSRIDLNDNFTAGSYYSNSDNIEVYYLISSDKKAIYGWVHNLNKYWKNSYYYSVRDEKYFYCKDSTGTPGNVFQLHDVFGSGTYDVTFYPTRMGSQALPDNQTGLTPSSPGNLWDLFVPITTVELGCDSTSADFAFTAIQHGSGHRMARQPDNLTDNEKVLYFELSPNPNKGLFNVVLPAKEADNYSIFVYDPGGKLTYKKENLHKNIFELNLTDCPKGIYFVQLVSNNVSSFKKVIVQ